MNYWMGFILLSVKFDIMEKKISEKQLAISES